MVPSAVATHGSVSPALPPGSLMALTKEATLQRGPRGKELEVASKGLQEIEAQSGESDRD